MENNYWKTAEQINGRLAMMGLFAAVINYGFTGWIVPGIIQIQKIIKKLSFLEGFFDVVLKITNLIALNNQRKIPFD